MAILNARPTTLGLAVLDAVLGPSDDGWHQLLPVGPFKARDGRPFDVPGGHWQLDKTIATTLINRAKALGQDILIDYDHQTLKVDQNGQPAPAAGWYNGDEIEWREGEGLFIKPRWTERAAALVAAKEYRFLSAVFPYDAQGRPPGAAHDRHHQRSRGGGYAGAGGLECSTDPTRPAGHPHQGELHE